MDWGIGRLLLAGRLADSLLFSSFTHSVVLLSVHCLTVSIHSCLDKCLALWLLSFFSIVLSFVLIWLSVHAIFLQLYISRLWEHSCSLAATKVARIWHQQSPFLFSDLNVLIINVSLVFIRFIWANSILLLISLLFFSPIFCPMYLNCFNWQGLVPWTVLFVTSANYHYFCIHF